MSPFSNRLPPPTIEPLAPLSLQSGDYQSADDPPPASVFKRGPHPAPPHSLSPVAMHAEAVLSTGPHMPIEVRRGPGLWTGITILIAGIAIGTLVGLTTRKMPNPADVLAQVHSDPPAVSVVPPASAPAASAPAPKDPPKEAAKDASAKEAKEAKDAKKRARAAAHAAAPKAPKEPKEAKEPAVKATKEKEGDDGYTVASADNGHTKPVLSESASGAAKESKSDKSDAKSDKSGAGDKSDARAAVDTKKPSKSAAASGKAASDDAVNVLKAAMGATENTL